ncbi:MAG: DNA gyrase inhibitor YacG [Planctomycetaceae bacterium]|nr:DNA gyrase inhibitor YacG [Planctomycetaceae bacterium]
MIRPQTCPICDTELVTNAATTSPLFPFCSKRCKLIDLHRWTEGQYAVVEPLTPERIMEEMLRDDPEAFEGGM